VTSNAPISIVFREDPSPCIQCGACEKICPVDLDPKALGKTVQETSYGDAECLRCGDCIEACRMIFRTRKGQTPPLRFGMPKRLQGTTQDEQVPGEAPGRSPSVVP
jgi:ferredoxin